MLVDKISARVRKVGDVLFWKGLALDVVYLCVVVHPRPFHQPHGDEASSMRMIINKVMISPGAALESQKGKWQEAKSGTEIELVNLVTLLM